MKKVELITLVNNIEMIEKLKELLEKNNIEFEDEMETNERYSQSIRGLRYIKHVDYIITIYVKEDDLEKALNIQEIAYIIYGNDQNIIENVSKEEDNNLKEDKKEDDSDEKYEDMFSKIGRLFGKFVLYCLYSSMAITCLYLLIKIIKK